MSRNSADDEAFLPRGMRTVFPRGSVTALVGGDGAGKTRFLRALATQAGRKKAGLGNLSQREITYQPAASGTWMNLSVDENLHFIAQTYRLEAYEQRVEALLEAAELQHARTQLVRNLSGGMRQKLGVIMALLPCPKLVLLDEPTTGVDTYSRTTLWNLIHQAAHKGSTVFVATTYLDEAEQADQIVLLHRGEALAQGTLRNVLDSTPGVIWKLPGHSGVPVRLNPTDPFPPHGHARGEDTSCPALSSPAADETMAWQRGHNRYLWTPHAASSPGLEKADLDLELSAIATLLSQGSADPLVDEEPELPNYPCGDTLIHVRGISKSYGGLQVLDDVDLDVSSGQILGLVGGNGAGKSTLIRILLGLTPADSGQITLCGTPHLRRARREIGYVPQTLGLYDSLTPQENLTFTANAFSKKSTQLHVFDQRPVRDLPLGARRWLAVACAMSHHPRLLILDEPTSGMDPLSRARLWSRLHQFAQRGVGILVTTHYQHETAQCDDLLHLHMK